MKRKQSGMTMLGFLITLGVGMFFAYCAMKILPMYIEFYSVKKALASMQAGFATATSTIRVARDRIGVQRQWHRELRMRDGILQTALIHDHAAYRRLRLDPRQAAQRNQHLQQLHRQQRLFRRSG